MGKIRGSYKFEKRQKELAKKKKKEEKRRRRLEKNRDDDLTPQEEGATGQDGDSAPPEQLEP